MNLLDKISYTTQRLEWENLGDHEFVAASCHLFWSYNFGSCWGGCLMTKKLDRLIAEITGKLNS